MASLVKAIISDIARKVFRSENSWRPTRFFDAFIVRAMQHANCACSKTRARLASVNGIAPPQPGASMSYTLDLNVIYCRACIRPMPDQLGDITGLLQRLADGDPDVENQLYPLLLPELRRRAHRLMRQERQGHTLQPTDLVNAVYLRVAAATKDRDQVWRNRAHFYAFFARAMRRYLIDYAKRRPKVRFVPIEDMGDILAAAIASTEQATAVNDLLDKMGQVHPDWVKIVEMKYFGAFSSEETADAMDIPLRTMEREWSDARHWLFTRLRGRKC